MADASMRLPRLERLGAALGLCDFEKNVVLAADVDFMLLARKYELQGGFIKVRRHPSVHLQPLHPISLAPG